MNNPVTDDCYFHREDSRSFKVFCRKENKDYDEAIVEANKADEIMNPTVIDLEKRL